MQLVTADGQRLDADIQLAHRGAPARGGVVLCHPHPLYGGNRHHPLIEALFVRLPHEGFDAIRFDFRAAHGGGVAERLDVLAALDALDARPGPDDGAPDASSTRAATGVEEPASPARSPRYLVGYSFGAGVAMAVDDARVASVVAVAAPLDDRSVAPRIPLHLLSPRHDQFCAYDRARSLSAHWPMTTVEVIEHADHFLHGCIATVVDMVVATLTC